MAGAPQGGGGQSDNSMAIIWIIVGLFALFGFIWYVFRAQISYFFLTIKLHEAELLSYLSNHLNLKAGVFDQLYVQLQYARDSAGSQSFNDLIQLGTAVGDWLRWPIIAMCVLFAIVIYFGSSTRVYKRSYSMKELANLEKVNWPQINPVTNLDLIKTDIDHGPWAMALNPMQFCKRHKLLQEVMPQRAEGMSRKQWSRIDVVLKRGEANKIFALQLGAMWRGTKYLPDYTKALFAAFAARINADKDPAEKLLLQLNYSQGKSIDMSAVDALIAKYENSKLVQQITQSHAYVYTVMSAMLAGAREDGVQASADFLWLKPMDRRLWYTLNTVGRQTPFIEVAGIFAHWVAEKEAGRKLVVPMVEEATNAVELALKEVVYKRDEEGVS